ncbi:MAG: glycosyltransferase [Candidatus Parvarchaeota archaeon]
MSEDEIYIFKQGDSLILFSVINEIRELNGNVKYISYRNLGITGKIIDLFWKIKDKKSLSNISGSSIRWVFTFIFFCFIRTFSLFDYSFKLSLKNIFKDPTDLAILFTPYLYIPIKRIFLKNQKIKFILYETNIEKKFFEFHLSTIIKNKKILNLISKIIEFIESEAINSSYFVLTASKKDMISLRKIYLKKDIDLFFPIKSEMWISAKVPESIVLKDVLKNKNTLLNRDIWKITFLGSNYSLNVKSVLELIRFNNLNKDFSDNLTFVIVGNISDYFKDIRDIPDNFIFTGFVKNIEEIMKFTDFFIMFDFMPTGIETKSIEYAKYFKPTIVVSNEYTGYEWVLENRLIAFSNLNDLQIFLEGIIYFKQPRIYSYYRKLIKN